MNNQFEQYYALGDSISICAYAQRELEARGIYKTKVGAASLLYRNDDDLFPDFRGRDLESLFPGIIFNNDHSGIVPTSPDSHNLTVDGAVVSDVAHVVSRLQPSDARTLITLTVGGNDFISGIQGSSGGRMRDVASVGREIAAQLEDLVGAILQKFPHGHLLLSTVYDPSGGVADIFGNGRPEALVRSFDELNEGIRAIATANDRVTLADLHEAFLGHGVDSDDCWFYAPLPIEPSSVGSSEVRRTWLEAIESLPLLLGEGSTRAQRVRGEGGHAAPDANL